MAIDKTNEVKFLYAAQAAKASKEVGVISFAEDTRQILVGTGADAAVAFAGNVKNATFTDGILTIERNSGDNLTLNFKDIASATQTMAAFKSLDDAIKAEAATRAQNDTALDNKITEITREGGTIDTKVAVETKAREDADKAINDKIGTVADGSTLVGMIADAKAAAIAAGTIVTEESDFITVEKTGEEGGTQTYTIKTTDIQSAEAYNTKMQSIDSSFTKVEGDIATLTSGENSVDKRIENAIKGLESSESGTDDSSFVTVNVSQTAGEITSVSVSTTDIASAKGLTDVSVRLDAFLNGEGVADTVDTLKDIQAWINGEGVNATELTKAIADEANLRALADTSIRNDFAAEDTSVLNAAKAYTDLLDASVDARLDALDASAHWHDNKSVLDGITSDDVAKARSAVQTIVTGGTNGTISVDGKEVSVAGLGSAAYTAASAYATAAQGALADSAVQSVTEGTVNGTIKVDDTNVAVHGLGSAAYTESSAYDAAGTATTKADAALNAAKAYADAIKVNNVAQNGQAITITSDNIKVGGAGNHKDASLSTSIEDLYTKVNEAQNAGVQSFAVASDSSAFASVDESTGAVSFSVKTVALDGLTDSSANGLVDAKTVKAYVDAAEARATLKWMVA